jgi:hypothetical protein
MSRVVFGYCHVGGNHERRNRHHTRRHKRLSHLTYSLLGPSFASIIQFVSKFRTNLVFNFVIQPSCTEPMSSKPTEDDTASPHGEDSASVKLPYVATVSFL